MKNYIRNFEKFVINEQSIITSSEYKKAMNDIHKVWDPIHRQWVGKTVNFYTPTSSSSNDLLGKFRIQDVLLKYTAGKEELQPYVVIQLGNGSIYAYESDLQNNSFKD